MYVKYDKIKKFSTTFKYTNFFTPKLGGNWLRKNSYPSLSKILEEVIVNYVPNNPYQQQ